MEEIKVLSGANSKEIGVRKLFVETYKNSPIDQSEILQNMGLYINRMNLSRLLFIDSIYKQIINVHGVIIEFGVRWGQNLALYINLRGIYEPYNYNRNIIGFDVDPESVEFCQKRFEKFIQEKQNQLQLAA